MFQFEIDDPHKKVERAFVSKIRDGLYLVEITTDDKWPLVELYSHDGCETIDLAWIEEYNVTGEGATVKIFHDFQERDLIRSVVKDKEYGVKLLLLVAPHPDHIIVGYEATYERT